MSCIVLRFKGPAFACFMLALVFSTPSSSGGNYTSEFVGELPPIKDVYITLFSSFIENASVDQLKVLIEESLTDDEKIVLRDFLGDEGIAALRAKAASAPDKESMLDAIDRELTDKESCLNFKEAFPLILAKCINILDTRQLEKQYSSLDEKEMGTISMYLDNEGLAETFKRVPPEKIEVILTHTPDWLFLELGKRKLRKTNTYECIFYKKEIVDDKQQDRETIVLKFRHEPWALYMKWIDGPFTGREVLFNERISSEDVRVRESGFLGIVAVDIPLSSSLARRGSNHVPTEIGIFYLLGMIEKNYRKAVAAGELERVNHGIDEVDGHKVFVTESVLPRDPSKGYYCYRIKHYIDYERSLEIKAEIFDWRDRMTEQYIYARIKENPEYTDADFDPDNPEYNL